MIRQLAKDFFKCTCVLEHDTTSTEVTLLVFTTMNRIEFNEAKKDFRVMLRTLGFRQFVSNLSIIRG